MHLRAATIDDCPLILQLVRELADYERLLHEVEASVALLQAHLFGQQPRAEALIVEADGEVAGFALFFHNFSTFLGRPDPAFPWPVSAALSEMR